MPWKDIEKQRAAVRRHYYANRQAYIDKAIRRRKQIRKWVNAQKESQPCADCREYYPYYVMDFDHIRSKNMEISKLIETGSMSRLKAEIAKCELVCANCHRKRTYQRLT